MNQGNQQENPQVNLSSPRSTATSDPQYDLISILYHSLQGAQICAHFVEDAGRENDNELAQFFTQVQQQENNRAEQAKQLLVNRIGRGSVAH